MAFMMSFTTSEQQVLKTQLQVMVIDGDGNVVEGAEIKLYKSAEDFENTKPAIEPGFSNKKGKYRFKGLEPISYFIEVKKGKLDNSLGAEKTSELTKGKINLVNVIIE